MKLKNLFLLIFSLFLTCHLQAQIVPPAATCGYGTVAAITPTEVIVCDNGTLDLPDNPGTGSPNYAYVITDPTNVILDADTGEPVGEAILGTVEEVPLGSGNFVLNATSLGLTAGNSYNVTGFGFDLANLNAIISGVYISNLCSLAVACNDDGDPANDFCQSCADGPGQPAAFTTLQELFDFASAIAGGQTSIEGVLEVIALISQLQLALGVPEPCYTINSINEYSIMVEGGCPLVIPPTDPVATCGYATVGAVAPAVLEVCESQTLMLNDNPGTGSPNYAYVITDPNNILLDADTGDPVGQAILGTVEEVPLGSGNFVLDAASLGLTAGNSYSVTGFGFDLANLNAIIAGVYISNLCTLAIACNDDGDSSNDFCQSCADAPPAPAAFTTLQELFDFASAIVGGETSIEGVLDVIGIIESLATALQVPAPCYTINGTYEYTIMAVDDSNCVACPTDPVITASAAGACSGGTVDVTGTVTGDGATFDFGGDTSPTAGNPPPPTDLGSAAAGTAITVTLPTNTTCAPTTYTITATATCDEDMSDIPETSAPLSVQVTVYPDPSVFEISVTPSAGCSIAPIIVDSQCPTISAQGYLMDGPVDGCPVDTRVDDYVWTQDYSAYTFFDDAVAAGCSYIDQSDSEVVPGCQDNTPGCTDASACNYNAAACVDDDSCLPTPTCNTDICAGDTEMIDPADACSCILVETQVLGCTDPAACNYNETANCDDSSCNNDDPMTGNTDICVGDTETWDAPNCTYVVDVIQVIGCTDPNATNYNMAANCLDDSCLFTMGCTDPDACNYDENATVDDGSCSNVDPGTGNTDICAGDTEVWNATTCQYDVDVTQVLGCTDATATNFNAAANCDDSSCTFTMGCTDPTACNYDDTATVDDDSCNNDDPMTGNTDICAGDTETWDAVNCTYVVDVTQVLGCTDATATNYNMAANCDDSSCTFAMGCTDPAACNYDDTATVDDGSCSSADPMTGNTDICAGDTEVWNATACQYDVDVAQVLGCTDANATNYNMDANCDDSSCTFAMGCTDPTACNYDENAVQDDGSCNNEDPGTGNTDICAGDTETWDAVNCTYVVDVAQVLGCTDATATNYNMDANCDDDSCIFAMGCTDPAACNYDEVATVDDGSCDYGNSNCSDPCAPVSGCTDANACNYDATACIDDGTCDLGNVGCPEPCNSIVGCTDPAATNYDMNATCDDGSCMFGDFEISDPCTCDNPDNYVLNNETYFEETVTLTGSAAMTWAIDFAASAGILDAAGNAQAGPANLVESPAGVYTYTFWHLNAVGYNMVVSNGIQSLEVSNSCSAPIWYEDLDGDGFGDDGSTIASCSQPAGYIAQGGELCPDIDDNLLGGPCPDNPLLVLSPVTCTCVSANEDCELDLPGGILGRQGALYGNSAFPISGNEVYSWYDENNQLVAQFVNQNAYSPAEIGTYYLVVTDPDYPDCQEFFAPREITETNGCCELEGDN